MNSLIIFKVRSFPYVSETFVVSNIIEAIKNNYEVKIIADAINPMEHGSQTAWINQYHVMDMVSVNKSTSTKYRRLLKFIGYSFNCMTLLYFIRYCIFKKKVSLSYMFNIVFYQQFKDAKLFHIHFPNTAEEISILKYLGVLKSKIIVTFHGFDAHYSNSEEKERLIKNYSRFYNLWDKITVNTMFLKGNILELKCPEDKIQVVPMAINLDFYKPDHYPKTIQGNKVINLVSVGRLIQLKGHEYGIQAVKLLIEKGYNVKYTIVGVGKLYKYLETLINNLDLKEHITLYGKASQEEVRDILDNSHVFLMTSVADENGREETQGVVTAEAQAMGVPVVGFKSGGVPYTVANNTAILVRQKDTEALVDALAKVINSKTYSQMSLASRTWAISEFGLPKMIRSFYEDIV